MGCEDSAAHRLWRAYRPWVLGTLGLIVVVRCLLPAPDPTDERPDRGRACLYNLKQLGLAIGMYSQDYDASFPAAWTGRPGDGQAGGWMAYRQWPNRRAGDFTPQLAALWPYVKQADVFVCPSDRSGRGCSFAMNGQLTVDGAAGAGWHPGRPVAGVAAPAETVLLVESLDPPNPGPSDGVAQPGCLLAWRINDGCAGSLLDWFRHLPDALPSHNRHSNVCFADGHVKGYYQPTRDRRAPGEWAWGTTR